MSEGAGAGLALGFGELGLASSVFLVVTAFLTSTLAGVLGVGGGLLLLGVMGAYFPPATLIPLHGLVQAASNLSRAWFGRRHVRWDIAWIFLAGTVVGALAGAPLVRLASPRASEIALATLILALTWLPAPRGTLRIPGKFGLVGAFNSFVSLFVGATGPLVAPFFLRENLAKDVTITTQAVCVLFIHIAKVAVYFWLGFVVGPYLGLIGAMAVASVGGSFASRFVLGRVSEKAFRWLFRVAITVLAVRMLVLALT